MESGKNSLHLYEPSNPKKHPSNEGFGYWGWRSVHGKDVEQSEKKEPIVSSTLPFCTVVGQK